MPKRLKNAVWDEHLHTARAVTGAVVAIAAGFAAQHTPITELGLQTVLEMVWQRAQTTESDSIPAA